MAPPLFEPDDYVLLDLHFNQGKSYQEIADMYEVTKDGVYKRFRRMGVTEEGVSPFDEFCPWPIRDEHRESRPRRMLRVYEKRAINLRNGNKPYRGVPQWEAHAFEDWLDEVGPGRVLDYDPHRAANPACDKGGFFYRRRNDSDGDGPIRRPSSGRSKRLAPVD